MFKESRDDGKRQTRRWLERKAVFESIEDTFVLKGEGKGLTEGGGENRSNGNH